MAQAYKNKSAVTIPFWSSICRSLGVNPKEQLDSGFPAVYGNCVTKNVSNDKIPRKFRTRYRGRLLIMEAEDWKSKAVVSGMMFIFDTSKRDSNHVCAVWTPLP
ncbi:predicted protein [Sclerotinia sclerotiorum 1980 UF-70]|uniref:Uncharacterized protein n=1 Tax=Sclerotinia sclerotiorum (strain ATCC 18683 / 1980 / Ss-1) TaxID=665079 RepID=A7EXQ8_SCLS1|nr:predicted protein [Sclerotinia sclerotiorum 1980 UF-70]EDN94250.1 predicted protein [Sclerotinia sclerotiorum 1980 UF-70]